MQVEHGDRYDTTDTKNNFTGEACPETGERCDGFADPNPDSRVYGFFQAFIKVLAIRENLRQTVVDQMQLVMLIKNPDLDLSSIGNPRIDKNSIFYVGDSLGAIMGTIFLAAEPSLKAGVLNVAGGGLLNNLFINSPEQFGDNVSILQALYGFSPEDRLDRFSMFTNLGQTIFDGGDAITYAPWIIREPVTLGGLPPTPHDVLQIEVMGDQSMPNTSSEALARALGLQLLSPCLTSVAGLTIVPSPAQANLKTGNTRVTGAIVQYMPASHGSNLHSQWGDIRFYPEFPFPPGFPDERFPLLPKPIHLREPNSEALEQVTHFLVTAMDAGSAEIVSTKAPVQDFDGDGWFDPVDSDPLDPDVH